MTFYGAPRLGINGKLAHYGSANRSGKCIGLQIVRMGQQTSSEGLCIDNGPYTVSPSLVNFQILRDARYGYLVGLIECWGGSRTRSVWPRSDIEIRREGVSVREFGGSWTCVVEAGFAMAPRLSMRALAPLLKPSDGSLCRSSRAFGSRLSMSLEVGAFPTCGFASRARLIAITTYFAYRTRVACPSCTLPRSHTHVGNRKLRD